MWARNASFGKLEDIPVMSIVYMGQMTQFVYIPCCINLDRGRWAHPTHRAHGSCPRTRRASAQRFCQSGYVWLCLASLLLVGMPFVASSFLFLVAMPGAPSSILAKNIKRRYPRVTELCEMCDSHVLPQMHEPLGAVETITDAE